MQDKFGINIHADNNILNLKKLKFEEREKDEDPLLKLGLEEYQYHFQNKSDNSLEEFIGKNVFILYDAKLNKS